MARQLTTDDIPAIADAASTLVLAQLETRALAADALEDVVVAGIKTALSTLTIRSSVLGKDIKLQSFPTLILEALTASSGPIATLQTASTAIKKKLGIK